MPTSLERSGLFDEVARCYDMSLGDHLHQGSDLTNSLAGVLIHFNMHKVALMVDIQAMFHLALVPPIN